MKAFLTIPQVAAKLGVTVPRARYAIQRLGIDPPIAGRTRLIPLDWVASIKAKLAEDRRHMNGKPKANRPRNRLGTLCVSLAGLGLAVTGLAVLAVVGVRIHADPVFAVTIPRSPVGIGSAVLKDWT
jgi:hypothetical protein